MSTQPRQTFPVIVEADPDGGFVVTNPSLPGCYSQGETIEEALANIREATLLCLEDLRETHQSSPEPGSVSLHLITT
ncbi:hypothetical protein GVX82_01575 [Patescibacteria group bacterium]|jgi:predicted RNase H-like HicB family nuclease|nr:hypothetical protein [Patescibacteria group bacterium]